MAPTVVVVPVLTPDSYNPACLMKHGGASVVVVPVLTPDSYNKAKYHSCLWSVVVPVLTPDSYN